MTTYDTRRAQQRSALRWALGAITLLSLGLFIGVFPQVYNMGATRLETVVGKDILPELSPATYRLGLDLQGGVHVTYDADMTSIPEEDRSAALEGARDVIERRVNAFGVSEPIVQTSSTSGYRIMVDLPGVTDAQEAIAQIGETPVLEFKLPRTDFSLEPTQEEQASIDAAQESERSAALDVLEQAKKRGADFSALVAQYSLDEATKAENGYLGFFDSSDEEYGGLVDRIVKDRLKTGVIDGLYEGTSRMHIVKYLGTKSETEAHASHILICYAGAKGCEGTLTRDEARAKAEELQGKATKENFAQLALENSTEPSAKTSKGDLGWVREGQMVAPFEDALFALRNGRISNVVETDFGFHIIYRQESRKTTLYELAHIEMPWTTASDVVKIDPWQNTELSGKHIAQAAVAFDQTTGKPYIDLQFNDDGAKLFAQITEANIGKVVGIFLDGQPITTPVVQDAIYGGRASISGDFTLAEAKLLAQRLTAGALPVPVTLLSQQTIGPTLGLISLEQSVRAGLLGFALIALFMVLYYRLPGFIAAVALVIYAGMNLAAYRVFGVTTTLSGIAGLVLSLGVAVDANVLVYERLKEELRAGRDLVSAIEEAYRRAWPSIRDGNFTTLIATGVLYAMSTGFIRGFALTLTLGILFSMFTALWITRMMLLSLARFSFLRKKIFFLGL